MALVFGILLSSVVLFSGLGAAGVFLLLASNPLLDVMFHRPLLPLLAVAAVWILLNQVTGAFSRDFDTAGLQRYASIMRAWDADYLGFWAAQKFLMATPAIFSLISAGLAVLLSGFGSGRAFDGTHIALVLFVLGLSIVLGALVEGIVGLQVLNPALARARLRFLRYLSLTILVYVVLFTVGWRTDSSVILVLPLALTAAGIALGLSVLAKVGTEGWMLPVGPRHRPTFRGTVSKWIIKYSVASDRQYNATLAVLVCRLLTDGRAFWTYMRGTVSLVSTGALLFWLFRAARWSGGGAWASAIPGILAVGTMVSIETTANCIGWTSSAKALRSMWDWRSGKLSVSLGAVGFYILLAFPGLLCISVTVASTEGGLFAVGACVASMAIPLARLMGECIVTIQDGVSTSAQPSGLVGLIAIGLAIPPQAALYSFGVNPLAFSFGVLYLASLFGGVLWLLGRRLTNVRS